MTEISEEDLIYFAGFLDGEGCFYISPPPKYKVHVRCSNTHKPVVEQMQRLFGGSFRQDKQMREHHKPCYTWAVVSKQAEEVCKSVLPYLREKQGQAMSCILIRQGLSQGRKPSIEIQQKRKRIYERYRESRTQER